MSLFIASLNSGSNGNCYYIGNEREAILVDVGITCREVEKRMERLSLPLENIKAIFISHEHSDHIRGLPGLARKYNLPVYITPGTLKHCPFSLSGHPIHTFSASESVLVGELEVNAFSKMHDAVDPHSFMISCRGTNVGVFTDIGTPCDSLTHYFQQCHAAFLEANYDEEMLNKGRYPQFLKKRIKGGKGHLSNSQAFALFKEKKPAYLSHLVLSHLSNENNCPDLVKELFSVKGSKTKVIVASRFEESAVYAIGGAKLPAVRKKATPQNNNPLQMSLF